MENVEILNTLKMLDHLIKTLKKKLKTLEALRKKLIKEPKEAP